MWYSEIGVNPWTDRWMVTVDCSTPAATVDVTISVPATHPLWDIIQADGDDIRVTHGDGATKLVYDLTSFTYATRTMTIEVDGVALTNTAGCYVLWVYAGSANAADGSAAVAIASAKTGHLEQALPPPAALATAARQPVPGSDTPERNWQKQPDERKYFWIDLTDLLSSRNTAIDGRTEWEEAHGIQTEISASSIAQAAMIEQGSTRLVEVLGFRGKRRQWAKVLAKAGINGTDYTVKVTILTMVPTSTVNQTIESRAVLSVVAQDEV